MTEATNETSIEKHKKTLNKLINLHKKNKLRGVYSDIPDIVYHDRDCPGLSSSGLVSASTKSFGHYVHGLNSNKEPTEAMEFGTAFHKLLLEPDSFHDEYVPEIVKPKFDRRTKAGKAAFAIWQEDIEKPWLDEHGHKKSLSLEKIEKLETMTNLAHRNEYLSNVMLESKFEESFFANVPIDYYTQDELLSMSDDEKSQLKSIFLKCRADIINYDMKIIVDVKTTQDASPKGFGRSCVNFNYDIKAEFYLKILTHLFGPGWNYFFYVAEKEPPFASANYYLYQEVRDNAQRGLTKWLHRFYRESKIKNKDYFYPKKLQPLNLPNYAFSEGRFDV